MTFQSQSKAAVDSAVPGEAPRTLFSRGQMRGALEGCALGTALWCTLFALEVLPGALTDSATILWFAALGFVCGAIQLRSILLLALQCAALVAMLIAVSPISETIAAHWIRNEPLFRENVATDSVAAVVVLSAGLNPDTTISSEAADHLIMGLELVRGGKSHVLVTTTTGDVFPNGFVSSEVDQARLIDLFDRQVAWMRTAPGHSTRDEALASAKLLLPKGMRHVAVVTSPMHTRRACAAFEAVGFAVTCVAARLRTSGAYPVTDDPTTRFAVFGAWIYEAAAMTEYYLRGWVHNDRIHV